MISVSVEIQADLAGGFSFAEVNHLINPYFWRKSGRYLVLV